MRVLARKRPDLPVDVAFTGDDVARLAAGDGADRQCRTRRVERRSRHRAGGAFGGQILNKGNQPRGRIDGVDAAAGARGMARHPANMGDKLHAALMAVERLHAGRLADDGKARQNSVGGEECRHLLRAEAADLLIKGEGKIERLGKLFGPFLKCRHHGQRHGKKPLHVDSTAPDQPSIEAAQHKGIAAPAFGSSRHDIEMPRQKHPAGRIRPDPGQKVEPQPVLVRITDGFDTQCAKTGFDIGDDVVIRLQADAAVADKVTQ